MANEIQISANFSATKNGVTVSGNSSNVIDMSGTNMIGNVQSIGIVSEQIVLSDVTTPGYYFFKNLDQTNEIRISLATPVSAANAFCTLKPNQGALIPSAQTTIHAIAINAPCDLFVAACEA